MSGPVTLTPGTPPTLPSDIAGLGSWYKNDAGIWSRSAALFVRAQSEYLSRASTSSLTMSAGQAWTIGGWVWLNSTGTDVLIAKRGSTVVEYQMYVSPGFVIITTFYNGSTYPGASSAVQTSGAWHFVIGSWSSAGGGTVSTQVDNGTLVNTVAIGTPVSGTNSIGLGADVSVPGNFYDGRMQNWFVFGRLLNTTERSFLWNGGNGRNFNELDAAFKTELRAWWPLDEKSGSRRDVSGNANTLTDNNTVTEIDGKVLNPIADGLRVYQWDDAGPKALHVSQATLANRPTYVASAVNGQPAIDFETSNAEALTRASVTLAQLPVGASGGNMMGVILLESPLIGSSIYGWNPAGPNVLQFVPHFGGNIIFDYGNTAGGGRLSAAIPGSGYTDAWHVVEAYRDGNVLAQVMVDGATIISSAFTDGLDAATSTWVLGGNGVSGSEHDGRISELAFYTTPLSASDRTALRNYYKTKYGLVF